MASTTRTVEGWRCIGAKSTFRSAGERSRVVSGANVFLLFSSTFVASSGSYKRLRRDRYTKMKADGPGPLIRAGGPKV